MSIINILPYLLYFFLSIITGFAFGKYINFLNKKGKEYKDTITKASKHEDIVDNQKINPQDNNIEEEKLKEIDDSPFKALLIKRKNTAKWKYVCSNCGFESIELVERCPHCKFIMYYIIGEFYEKN